jgi:flagellar biosynthesis protein FliQ
MSMADEIKGQVQVLFGGKPIQGVHLVVVTIVNSGNVPILPKDYYEPIKVSFGKKTQVLTAEVRGTKGWSLDIQNDEVMVKPQLLNQGEKVVLQALRSQFDATLEVDSHIAGVTRIKKTVHIRSETFTNTMLVLGLVLSFFVAVCAADLNTLQWMSLIITVCVMIGILGPYLI